jgi:outer membrane protein OmpA-like peptidoglycan-associated protein/tetratricopeptide (TPR) repeat protein
MKYHYIRSFLFTSIILLSASTTYATGWQKAMRSADENIQKKYYAPAAEVYEQVLAIKSFDLPKDSINSVRSRLAKCYMKMGNTVRAESIYADMVKSGKADAETIFNYARSLESNAKYIEANELFMKITEDKSIANKNPKGFAETCQTAIRQNSRSSFAIFRASFNTTASEYAPAYYGKALVFTSNRPGGDNPSQGILWNGEPFTDIYIALGDNKGDMRTFDKFPTPINSVLNDGATVFNAACNEIFFTRNNDQSKNHNQLQILRSTYDGKIWSNPELLPFEVTGANYAHPALSPDDNTLYFSSDIPDSGYGGMDIYMVQRINNNSWGTIVNLGPTINTYGNEIFPFVAADSTLYFTSDGWPGYGGMDIFYSKYKDEKFVMPVNMGYNFNSPKDDLSLIINTKSGTGYFASDRDGDDDIFSFVLTQQEDMAKASTQKREREKPDERRTVRIMSKITGSPMAGARIEISKPDSTGGEFYYTDRSGIFSYTRRIESGDDVKVIKDGYKTSFKGANELTSQTFEVTADNTLVNDKSNFTVLYYDIDSSDIKDASTVLLRSIVEVMKESGKNIVNVSGYADEAGTNSYNLELSHKRVKKVVNFLSSAGIDIGKIRFSYFGAVKLPKECHLEPDCATEANRENRKVVVYISTL